MIDAAFYTAGRLFGLVFTPRDDVPVYHRDVRAWEVTDAKGRHVGLFLGDYFAPHLETERRLDEQSIAARRSSPATSVRSSST